MSLVRKHFIFYGRVQGVGFRYTAAHIARNLKLTGWIQNEYDGTVSAEVQGSQEDIYQFFQRLSENRFIKISEIETKTLPVESDNRFEIRH